MLLPFVILMYIWIKYLMKWSDGVHTLYRHSLYANAFGSSCYHLLVYLVSFVPFAKEEDLYIFLG
jgi:hypothetical protein